jgi:uncharacterized protein (TIGR02246 family)
MKANEKTESEVTEALKTVADAYAKRDLKRFLACFAPDQDVVLYGTAADEKRIGLEQIQIQVERDWAQTETASMSFAWISTSASGSVAWAAVDGEFRFRADGQDMSLPARITFVLERREGRWLIVQAHFSTPASDQEEGQSF